jgi:putative (di)nucleoside polyphosphate hydrolase
MAQAQHFRANVGIVVLNERWQVLALERIDKEQARLGIKRGTGQWQMPQGGLDEGEEPYDAWQRELYEEIHVTREYADLIDWYPEWLAYELPKAEQEKPAVKAKHGRGQVQKWCFVRLKPSAVVGVETDDATDQEFFAYKWMTLGQLAEETWEVRRPIYLKLALHLAALRQRD